MLYAEYFGVMIFYPHWKPADIQVLTPRQRKYWEACARWKTEWEKSRMSSGVRT